jgi:hypothetical protein
MSTSATPALPVAPAAPLSGIQIIEQELANFARQEESALSQLHAIKGAIQAANFLLSRLKAEEQKAVEFAKAEFEKAKAAAAPVVAEVEAAAKKVEADVESAL